MESTLDESKAERAAAVRNAYAPTCSGDDIQEVAQRVEKQVNAIKTAVSAKLEDGKIAAGRRVKRGRFAVEDGTDETAHTIKRHPLSSLAIAFAAGTALGLLVPRFSKKASVSGSQAS